MGIIAAGQITVVDLSDAPVLNAFITASRPTTQTYSKDSKNYNPSYASTPQVLTLNVTKSGSTTSIIDSISGLHWFVVDGSVKTEITSKVNTSNEYISGSYNENLTTKLNIDTNKSYRRYEATGVWRDPSTDLDVQFSANIDLLLTQNGATGPQGPQGDKGDTGNGIANTVVTYGLSMSDTTEPATWSSDRPALVKGMYLWTRTVIIYTNGESTTSYQISYIPKDGDATGEIDKTKQELLEKLETVRDDSLAAVEEAKQQLVIVRDDSLAAAEEAKQQVTTVANDLSKAKTDFQNAVNTVDAKATNVQNDLSKAKQDLASQAQQLQEQANAQSELTNRVSSVEETANGTKTTVSELSKTVDQNGKNITSVTARTKVVEDDLAGTKTTLSQVKMTADSTSQKTATLETGLDGLSAKFDNLKIGGANLLLYSADPWKAPSNYYQFSGVTKTDKTLNGSVVYKTRSNWSRLAMNWGKHLIDRPDVKVGDEFTYSVYVRTDQESPIKARLFFRYSGQSGAEGLTGEKTITQEWQRFTKTFTVTKKMVSDSSKLSWVGFEQTSNSEDGKYVYYACNKLERGNIATDYTPNEIDLEQKVAEYKQTSDQNYASLQTTVQNLDGTVQANKTTAEQTAQGFKTRIESLETYKDGETTRANQYFESAKTETARQLTAERTAIAKDYVAKSTYTSDVAGIRNDLTATTTTADTIKTNLANYQASNDRAVANLQSNLQTANGNISSLKTKVEAVPGQITSAVSAVEGKIPTSAGGRNLALGTSGDWSGDWTNFNGQNNQTRTIYRIYNRGLKVGDKVNVRLVLKYSDIVAADGQTAKISMQCPGNVTVWGAGGLNGQSVYLSPDDNEVVLSRTTTIADDHLRNDYWDWGLRVDYVARGRIQWKEAKAEAGDLPTPWSPAPEDTISQINAVSSELKQTKDGITLLATKTELNTAKSDLQSGINTATNKANNAQNTANNAQNKANSNAQTISTHTTQISALNTGLNAKVSQTDFNTLSGRVTSAENNITAKANELSSKITSVEGKIPTNIGSVNLFKGSRDFSGSWLNGGNGAYAEDYKGVKIFKTQSAWSGRSQYFEVKTGEEYVFSAYVKSSAKTDGVNFFLNHESKQPMATGLVSSGSVSGQITIYFELTDKYKRIAIKIKITKDGWIMPRIERGNTNAYLFFGGYKLERGNVSSDWSPAPEDAINQIDAVSSELKQTKDGITLLATKTELNTAKNELQSGINTATNKANNAQTTANNAQNKANNNAQTINTHTTQISALNTGLQAKVSQSEFNTLSGRVTSAENNITAKANELSSKITSIEGKIPTEIGAVNLFKGSRDFSGSWLNGDNGAYAEDYKGVKIFKTQSAWGGRSQYFEVKTGEEYVFSAYVKSSAKTDGVNFFLYHESKQPMATGLVSSGSVSGQNTIYFELTDKYKRIAIKIKITKDGWIAPRLERGNTNAYLFFGGYKLERGTVATDWSPAPEDYDSKLAAAQSEFKQTTDSIKASVSSLDKSTVKSSSLTINSDGIVMKAGKSTTDVANAIGSYFSVNQNAIDLFADKIKVKGNMIVSGSISSDKIASNGITANVIKGGTLQSTNGSTNFELNTGKLFYNNNNTGVFRVQNGASTMGLKFSNTSVTVSGTSRILSRVILGGDRNETTLDDGKWDKGGFSGLVIETIKGAIPAVNEHADSLRAISDTIYFTHTYSADSPTGVSAHGWKMETYAPDSSISGNIVLKPYGINYRQSDIVVGDIRLDNGDGSGYWMRATINTLKACFGHILNGGTSSQALNGIRSELNKISGT